MQIPTNYFTPPYNVCQADAFIEKGKSLWEILAIVESLLRRVNWERCLLEKSDLTLDSEKLCVLKNGWPAAELSPEQFRLLAILIEKSPYFVVEEEICAHVFVNTPSEKQEAISSLAYRLRQKLGPQLARRIKNSRFRGWIYVQPRLRKKKPSTPELSPV